VRSRNGTRPVVPCGSRRDDRRRRIVPNLQDELLTPFVLEDRLRQAEARFLRQALSPPPGLVALLAAAIGRVLVAAGSRLEAVAHRSRTSPAWMLSADLCPDCGN
jgi:hypothetical protein